MGKVEHSSVDGWGKTFLHCCFKSFLEANRVLRKSDFGCSPSAFIYIYFFYIYACFSLFIYIFI